jgi:hypothetical protein
VVVLAVVKVKKLQKQPMVILPHILSMLREVDMTSIMINSSKNQAKEIDSFFELDIELSKKVSGGACQLTFKIEKGKVSEPTLDAS